MEQLQAAIESLRTSLEGMVVPLAIVGMLLWGIAFLVVPILPEWASGFKGYFKTALLVLGFLGFAPAIIEAFYAMGGGGGASTDLPAAALAFVPRPLAARVGRDDGQAG
ncbi:MAG: hypothetical protein AB4911_22675 [Oscillochloridaceae bacterium umkhey_bin13]